MENKKRVPASAAHVRLPPREDAEVNQCDGCRRHLPIKNGIHYGDEGYVAVMTCQRNRYV
jgi:hypothetical protein